MVSAGVGFSGAGAAQPFIQQLIAQQQQKQKQLLLSQALQKYAAQQGQGQQPGGPPPNGGQQPGTPPQLPPGMAPGGAAPGMPPQGGQPPLSDPAARQILAGGPIPQSPSAPGGASMPPGQPSPGAGLPQQGQQDYTAGMPTPGQMMQLLSSSKMAPDQMFAAMQDYMEIYAPAAAKQEQIRHDRAMENWHYEGSAPARANANLPDAKTGKPAPPRRPKATNANGAARAVSKEDVMDAYTKWQDNPSNKKLEDDYNKKRNAYNSASKKGSPQPKADVTPKPSFDSNTIIAQAKEAIAAGAPKDAVKQQLKDQGIMPPDDM